MEEADSLSLQKMKYRSLVKARRREMPEAELLAQSRAIFAKVAESSLYRKSRTVFVYMSMAGEVRTTEFIRKAWADGKKVAVPRTDMKKHRISFYYIESFDQVRPGVMGIMEPVTAEAARPGRQVPMPWQRRPGPGRQVPTPWQRRPQAGKPAGKQDPAHARTKTSLPWSSCRGLLSIRTGTGSVTGADSMTVICRNTRTTRPLRLPSTSRSSTNSRRTCMISGRT